MKKLISLLLCAAMSMSSVIAFAEQDTVEQASQTAADESTEVSAAENTPEAVEQLPVEPQAEETIDPAMIRNQVTLHVDITDVPNIEAADVCFELYSIDDRLLSSQSQRVDTGTKLLEYTFTVPEYTIGEAFKLRCISGLKSIRYYSDTYYPGQDIIFYTYSFADDGGNRVISDGISISGTPNFTKNIVISYNGVTLSLYPAPRLINGVTMVPIRQLAEYIGFSVEYNADYNVEIVSLGTNKIYFNIGTAYTTVFGNDTYASAPTQIINDTVYVSLRTFADAIESDFTFTEYSTAFGIVMKPSRFVNDYYTKNPINKWGIASRTNYLVWVSKSEYKVRVYKGKQYQWQLIYEAPCAIGAPGTPTITGSYEYQYKTQWNYNGYYVGPCLVFHGGYALHSVLLRYDNTEYDGRTGVQISHGCIRLKKKDIDWIANTIPIKTRIYLTE
ncbi:MAG: L,D-transpeptidase family protein [Clostridiales bacterium]|nr:L,D-transpeptidase family protein [Clostridiales bacterium]